MPHSDDNTPRLYLTKRDTREIVRVATHNLFYELNRPPKLHEIAQRVQRSKSVVRNAITDLHCDGVVMLRNEGKVRRIVGMQGVPSEAERLVRQLESGGLLKVSADKALAFIARRTKGNSVALG